MSRLTPVNQNLFGNNTAAAGNFGVFGSRAAGTPLYSKDPATIQSLVKFLEGWSTSTVGTKNPCLEDMNSLFLLAFFQIAGLLQNGVPPWVADRTYYIGQFASDGAGKLYRSKVDANLNNALSDTNSWEGYLEASLPAILNSEIPPKSRCKAWVTFSGNGTATILDSYNVSAVNRVQAGVYDITFTTPLANANYSFSGSAGTPNGSIPVPGDDNFISGAAYGQVSPVRTVNTLRVVSMNHTAGTVNPEDSSMVSVQVFGS